VAGCGDGSVSVPASLGDFVPGLVNKKASALFQADAAEVLRVYKTKILLHKPHPRKELLEYQIKQLIEQLEQEGLL
jgi:hypothetical protein